VTINIEKGINGIIIHNNRRKEKLIAPIKYLLLLKDFLSI
jgi:hypothetical protein